MIKYLNIKGFEATDDEKNVLIGKEGVFALTDPIFLNYNPTIINNATPEKIELLIEKVKHGEDTFRVIIINLTEQIEVTPGTVRNLFRLFCLTRARDVFTFCIADLNTCPESLYSIFDKVIEGHKVGGNIYAGVSNKFNSRK